MSGGPWTSPQQGAWGSGFGAGDSAFPGSFGPTTQTQQSHAPPASTGWVSFDDDANGFGFRPATSATAAALSAPPPQPAAGQPPAPGFGQAAPWTPSFSSSMDLQWPATGVLKDPVAATGSIPTKITAVGPGPTTEALPQRDQHGHAPASPSANSAPALPCSSNGLLGQAPRTSAALSPQRGHGSGGVAGTAANGTVVSAAAPPTGGSLEPPPAAAIHRLPRPPTTASRGAATASNPFATLGGSPAQAGAVGLTTSNPFAAGARPPGSTSTARSLDPFADLSLKPQLPRPPPMAAAKGPPTTTPSGAGPSPSPPPPPARPAGTQESAACSDPAPASMYPTFASLHRPAYPASALSPGAPAGCTGLSPSGLAPGSPPLTAAASPRMAPGALTPGGLRHGVVETSNFDAFTSPNFPHLSAPQRDLPNDGATAAPPSPPAPLHSAGAAMVFASLPLPPSYNGAGGRDPMSPRELPPPPPYIDAIGMPPAQPQAQTRAGVPPPPSYEESFALPTADAITLPQQFNPPHLPPQPSPPLPSQICVEVRLPPLKPKEAGCPRRLVAGMRLAFAAPGGDGVSALQWCLHPGNGVPAAGSSSGGGDGAAAGPHFVLPPGGAGPRNIEDWDSAPAAALSLPPTVSDMSTTCCMLLDDISGSLWTGHKDGRVVRWSVAHGRTALYEHHWKAHVRGKITCMTLTPWGELWTASSAGTIRSWQYPQNGQVTRPPIRLFECRRARLTMGPSTRANAQRAHSKARLLALGPSGRVVWSAGRTGLVLWGAYDGEFLGTLTPVLAQDGRPAAAGGVGGVYAGDTGALARESGSQQQMEINPQTGLESALINRPLVARMPPESAEEPDTGDPDIGQQMFKGLAGAAKLAARLGKKIRQNFATDSATGGADGYGPNDPGVGGGLAAGPRGKVAALVPGLHQSMYVAYQGGWLEKYTEWGRLIWSREYGRGMKLYSAALVGSQLWLGCGDGAIRTAAASTGELGRCWKAHDFPVVALALDAGGTGRGSGLVYSLSENGSVRAWPAVLPSEAHLLAWRDGLLPCLRRKQLAVLAATWNVNETRPSSQSLRRWLEPAASTEIVSIALQEVEMGTSSVARDAAITLLSKSMLERGNQNAQWWASELAAALLCTGHSWVRVALRQMSGLVLVVFCRAELLQHVGEVATANVACGVMGVGGNKGAVAVSMSVFRRRLMFVSSHFAAHQERVDERNENYNKIVRQLHFENTSKAAQRQRQQQQQQPQDGLVNGRDGVVLDGSALDGTPEPEADPSMHRTASGTLVIEMADDGHGPGMADAAMLVWAGDFNYRIRGAYAEVCELASAQEFAQLFAMDQCRQEMERGTIFRGLREPIPLGHPVFVPTYKYDKGEPYMVAKAAEPGARVRLRLPFDSSEKQRVPAWTDRVFYRGSRPGSLDVSEEEVQVSIGRPTDYNCVLEVNDSDHKPVFALLQVQLPAYKQEEKRRHSLAAAMAVDSAALSAKRPLELHPLRLSTAALEVRPNGVATVELVHTCVGALRVQVIAERPADGVPCSLPCWLEVAPTTFAILPREGLTGEGLDVPLGRTRIVLRALSAEGFRGTESVQLRFALQPVWGSETRAGAPGPTLSVTLRQ